MEKDKDGKPFFTTKDEAMHFAFARLLYQVIMEPIFEEETTNSES